MGGQRDARCVTLYYLSANVESAFYVGWVIFLVCAVRSPLSNSAGFMVVRDLQFVTLADHQIYRQNHKGIIKTMNVITITHQFCTLLFKYTSLTSLLLIIDKYNLQIRYER